MTSESYERTVRTENMAGLCHKAIEVGRDLEYVQSSCLHEQQLILPRERASMNTLHYLQAGEF